MINYLMYVNQRNLDDKACGIVDNYIFNSFNSFVECVSEDFEIDTIISDINVFNICKLGRNELLDLLKDLICEVALYNFNDLVNPKKISKERFEGICLKLEKYFGINIINQLYMFNKTEGDD